MLDSTIIEAGDNLRADITSLGALREVIAEFKEREAKLLEDIRKQVGTGPVQVMDGFAKIATQTVSTRKSVDTKALAERYPDIASELTRESTVVTFRVPAVKKAKAAK